VYERKDAFYKKAKQEGYRSRSAYKLLELNREFHFLKPGDRVIDLGAWPGGWVQVAAGSVGPAGKVVGIDLVKLDPLPLANVTLVQGDATDPLQQEKLLMLLGGPADVLLSDMAPKLSGIREVDEARSIDLCRAALTCAPALLRLGRSLLLKVFMGPEHKVFLAELRAAFATVKATRPEATRKGSAETYVLASGLKKH
jgi:23S rRNA (uridine2552-2'-O)-methyltransferase